ncbi:unnamed protein product [marine sediment metagenome]|uniref:Uncharacterized protein n=1 Tax=marine sediment metagenome TaxID=412755 RepID=X0XEY2_9ZZZZ
MPVKVDIPIITPSVAAAAQILTPFLTADAHAIKNIFGKSQIDLLIKATTPTAIIP